MYQSLLFSDSRQKSMPRLIYLLVIWSFNFLIISPLPPTNALREFRTWSNRTQCEMAIFPNWPFAYEKYKGQKLELKGRVNSNLQDFRHPCQVQGGNSKCHICEEIECSSELGTCQLQLQGVSGKNMSKNVPVNTDDAWAVNGTHRHDYGSPHTTHFCVFIAGHNCSSPSHTDFTDCPIRCFGHGFPQPAIVNPANYRTRIDLYDGMPRWYDDAQVDLWEYPKSCEEVNSRGGNCTKKGPTPTFNPQGFTFTFAGDGQFGLVDGPRTQAQFNAPEDVAVDEFDNLFIADTGNHAIRMINATTGLVSTIAGRGPSSVGRVDGDCSIASFNSPKGIDVAYYTINGVETLILVVADTGNSRVRRIDIVLSTGLCTVRCLTGLCGNDTLSFTDSKYPVLPYAGFADGPGDQARLSAPESVCFMDGGYIAVADTGNWLVRWVNVSNGMTWTLAGTIGKGPSTPDGKPVGGCPPPCLVGVPGFRDGELQHSMFYSVVDVTRGPNNTIIVADEHRIRMIELADVVTSINTVKSSGRVSTVAGNALQGYEDGRSMTY